MLLTHDLNSSRNDIDLLVPPCPYLIFFCGRCHHLLQQSYTSRMTVHGRMWPCAAAAVCDSCTLGATPGCTNWRHGAFPSTALAELHPGEGPGQQPPPTRGPQRGTLRQHPFQACPGLDWGLIVLATSQRSGEPCGIA